MNECGACDERIGGICEMYMCLTRDGVGGEGVSG